MNQLTVAVPTFGQAVFLDKCLDSLANQTTPVDCIVCDGGSNFNFNSPKWNWIQYRQLLPDPGIAGCWSEAANLSQTEYIAFLADDNMFEPKFAELMINFLKEHPACEVVFCNQYLMDETGQINIDASHKMTRFYGRHRLQYGLIKTSETAYLIQNNSIPLEACVIKSSTWQRNGAFAQQAFGALDLHFFTKLLVSGVQFGFIPNYLARFRVHSGSYTVRKSEEHLRGAIWALQDIQSTNNKKYNSLLAYKENSYLVELLKCNISNEEKLLIQKYLSASMSGLKLLTKSKLKLFLKNFF